MSLVDQAKGVVIRSPILKGIESDTSTNSSTLMNCNLNLLGLSEYKEQVPREVTIVLET